MVMGRLEGVEVLGGQVSWILVVELVQSLTFSAGSESASAGRRSGMAGSEMRILNCFSGMACQWFKCEASAPVLWGISSLSFLADWQCTLMVMVAAAEMHGCVGGW